MTTPTYGLDLAAIASAWLIPSPWRLTPLTQGANNLTLRLTAADASERVLRIYRNHADPLRIHYEHRVLAALHASHLPFAIPAPLPTTTGSPLLHLTCDGAEALATLTPYLPGAHPTREDPTQAYAAGAALGALAAALAHITPPGGPDIHPLPPIGDYRARSALDTDPLATIRALPAISAESVTRITALLQQADHIAQRLYATLPQQLVHNDLDPSNILFVGPRVSAILDFEFCAVDLRIGELGAPFTLWVNHLYGSDQEWPILDAIGRGYISQHPLTSAERAALPDLLRIRAMGTLLHRIARARLGHTIPAQLAARVAATLARDAWLTTNQSRLLRLAHAWEPAPGPPPSHLL